MNLFASVLTYSAPSANYRGENELNRSVIQKVTDGRFDYPIISPEAMRNALREILRSYGLPLNRTRLEPVAGERDEKQQLAVRFDEFPDPSKFADDFLFGYLLAVKGSSLAKVRSARGSAFPLKRDSVLRMNLAKALEPYRHNAVFTQSPQIKDSPWKSDEGPASSSLLHRETAVTAFQYPVALNLNDCATKPKWTRALLKAIGELSGVAGNHARSYFEMAPASIVVRLTEQLVAGYDTYGFRVERKAGGEDEHGFPEVVGELLRADATLPGKEFFIGGKVVRQMNDEVLSKLKAAEVTLDRDPRRLLMTVADHAGLIDDSAAGSVVN